MWTGSEMIVWGGIGGGYVLNTGGRYNPSTDSWTATSTTNAPAGRYRHTAVWNGSEMIVWGGYDRRLSVCEHRRKIQSQHRQLDSHQHHQRARLPRSFGYHTQTSVWTGSEMIVWGGMSSFDGGLNTGGRYNPSHRQLDKHQHHQRARMPDTNTQQCGPTAK